MTSTFRISSATGAITLFFGVTFLPFTQSDKTSEPFPSPWKAISYVHPKKAASPAHSAEAAPKADKAEAVDASRRGFLTASLMTAAAVTVKAQEKKVDGGLAVIEDKVIPDRQTPIVPPGAVSLRHFAQHCTGCQLCVSVCPNGVLRPATDLMRLMQPEMSYERGYCRPECTKCSEVCPAGAIRPIDVAEKSATHIGHAVWVKHNCIPVRDGQSCGNCAVIVRPVRYRWYR